MLKRTLAALALLAVALPGRALSAEVIVARVLAVGEGKVTVSAGSDAGVVKGQKFAVAPLAAEGALGLKLKDGSPVAPAGGAVGSAAEVRPGSTVIEIEQPAPGFEAAPGMIAVWMRPAPVAPAAPVEPGGFRLTASATSADPGDDIVVTASAHKAGAWYTWESGAGSLSHERSTQPSVTWTAPRGAGKAVVKAVRHEAGEEDETSEVELQATGEHRPLPEKVSIERTVGSRRFGEAISSMHRIGDITFDDRGYFYMLDTRTKRVYGMDVLGQCRVTVPREVTGAQVLLGPTAVTAVGPRLYVADSSAGMIKVYDADAGDDNRGKFLRTIGAGERMGRIVDLASEPGGKVYALDSSRRSLHVFGPDGSYIRNFGRKGAGRGEFLRPVAAECDLAGNVYVLDTAREDVQIFDESHNIKRSFGVTLKGLGDPVDITVRRTDGSVLVLHGDPSPAVAVYDKSGKLVANSLEKMSFFARLPAQPLRITGDASGSTVISERGRRRLHRYDVKGTPDGRLWDVPPATKSIAVSSLGTVLGVAGRSPLLRIWDTAWWLRGAFLDPKDEQALARSLSRAAPTGDGSLLCAVDPGTLNVLCFDREGKLFKLVGGKATDRKPPPEKLQSAADIAPAPGRKVAVLDSRSFRVVTYDPSDKSAVVTKLMRGRMEGGLSSPSRLAVDVETGWRYIYDRKTRRIMKYDEKGQFLGSTGGAGEGPGRFTNVERMVVGLRGELWVFDAGRRDIQRMDFRTAAGKSTFTIGREPFDGEIVDIGVGGGGRLYVLTSRDTIYVFVQLEG